MNSKHTLNTNLLIVGAGAHKPYDFPTSSDINENLKSLLKARKIDFNFSYDHIDRSSEYQQKQKIFHSIKKTNILEISDDLQLADVIENFISCFAASGATSIDSYISRLPSSDNKVKAQLFPKIGKFILAYLISHHETKDPLGCQRPDWIQFFIKEYVEPNIEEFFENPPNIVTFNYDRLFEKFLFEHLKEFHHINEGKAEQLINNLNIIHVYGTLGKFTNWNGTEDQFFKNAMDNIKVIGEDRDAIALGETKQNIQSLILKSKKIYFLGYGFDPLNNNIIFDGLDSNWRSGKSVFSTNIGFGKRDLQRIRKEIDFIPTFLSDGQSEDAIDCLTLLRNKMPLEQVIKPAAKIIRKRSNYL